MMNLKAEIRVLGIDDSPLIRDDVLVVGAVFRGGDWLDGVMKTSVKRDGVDATKRLTEMILSSKHLTQFRVMFLDGVTFAGFNVVDIHEIYKQTSVPVVVVTRNMPDMDAIKSALSNLEDGEERFQTMLRAGELFEVDTGGPTPVYIQCAGISSEYAAALTRMTSIHASIPEPLRVAHMIATAMVLGESTGKA